MTLSQTRKRLDRLAAGGFVGGVLATASATATADFLLVGPALITVAFSLAVMWQNYQHEQTPLYVQVRNAGEN